MDKLIELIKSLLGEAFTEDVAAKVEAAAELATKAAADGATDESRVRARQLEADLKKAEARAKKAEDKLADASGDADQRVAELRGKLGDAEATVKRLEAEAIDRQKRALLLEALRKAEVPEDRRTAALDLLAVRGLDSVVLDDKAEDGLAGHKAAFEQLKARNPFLWEAPASAGGDDKHNGQGGGGPSGNGGPKPKPPKLGDDARGKSEALGVGAVAAALQSRGRKVRGHEAASAAGS